MPDEQQPTQQSIQQPAEQSQPLTMPQTVLNTQVSTNQPPTEEAPPGFFITLINKITQFVQTYKAVEEEKKKAKLVKIQQDINKPQWGSGEFAKMGEKGPGAKVTNLIPVKKPPTTNPLIQSHKLK